MSTCHCNLGLSAHSSRDVGHLDHPHDPGDLQRCVEYCRVACIDTKELRRRMAGRSPQWDVLLAHWGELVGMLTDEVDTRRDGCAPATYRRMRDLLEGTS